MKIKRIVSLLLALVMIFGMISTQVCAESEITVLLDGEKLVFDVAPKLINNRTMVPMRKIFESMGAEVEWEAATQTITATKDDIVVVMQIGNNLINVNGKDIAFDVAPQLVDGRTLVPARAVAESLKAKVDWDGDTRTVIITSAEKAAQITPIDLDKQTEFVCNVGATITYGFDDIWCKTVGTEFVPYIKTVGSAYRGQIVLISPLYANFAIDDKGCAKVVYSIKLKYPNGTEVNIAEDIVAFDGTTMPKQIIKSISGLEYAIDDTDPLGTYTFTIESKDVIGNKTIENVFSVNFTEYEYEKSEFGSIEELTEFVTNYSRNPDPDRIIDAIIYAEKQGLVPYPVFFTAFVEMLAKNPYLVPDAVDEFEKEFGEGGTETLVLLQNTAAQYLNIILTSNPPTFTRVVVTESIDGNIMMYGNAVGAYFAGASYDAAKALVQSLKNTQFSSELMRDYGVPELTFLIENDPLFRAYCVYMLNFEKSLDIQTKEALFGLLK